MARDIDYNQVPVQVIEQDLGRRLEALRLARNINQSQLAAEAGVSRRTITRLENGAGVSVDTLIRVLKALGLADRLVALLPDPAVRPIDRVRLGGRERRRARPRPADPAAPWQWADDGDGG
ncbi:MAG TPA: helix-turn-helix transcriptional regulator [Woeseiaceae bacterium]|nr:helix-turn-helix transcriptional regulator [Woeseiaceae bacterium]